MLLAVLTVFLISALLDPRGLEVVPGVKVTEPRGLLLTVSMVAGLLLGCLLPDLDGGGKVSLYLPPFMGAYSLFLLTISNHFWDPAGTQLFQADLTGYLLTFSIFTVISYGFLFLPKRHRGFMHQPMAALLFGVCWSLYHIIFLPFKPAEVFLIFAGSTLGYASHLAMDWLYSFFKEVPAIGRVR